MANLQKLRAKAFVLATKMGLAAEAYWATVKPAVYYAFYQCSSIIQGITASEMFLLDYFYIVSRTVTETSSNYKLKDESGKVVATKRVREELQKILNQFNIQVT